MQLKKKALLNLLQFNCLKDLSLNCKEWQKEDLRKVKVEDIFSRLNNFSIELEKNEFVFISIDYESPEDLIKEFVKGKYTEEDKDQIFLLIFELWRRLVPEKLTLSLFCDELDYRIFLYNRGELENDEIIQDSLANLEELLDENVDIGAEPEFLFQSLVPYCSHNLENFIYNYIYEQIEVDNKVYASELIEGFYPYIVNIKWFDFLKVILLASTDIAEANNIIFHIMKDLKNSPDEELQLNLLQLMIKVGNRSLFVKLVKMTLELITTQERFIYLLHIVSDFFRCIDQEEKEKIVKKIINKRAKLELSEAIDKKEEDYKLFASLLV
jgi:hypothetical protein